MGGFLMSGSIFHRPVDFDQKKTGAIIGLLDKVETGNARLLQAAFGILDGCGNKFFRLIILDMDKDMYNMHATILILSVDPYNTPSSNQASTSPENNGDAGRSAKLS
jgi:hypothetical protein